MSHQIIRQPDGLLCVWSDDAKDFILFDMDAEDVLRWYVNDAIRQAVAPIRAQYEAAIEGAMAEAAEPAALRTAAEINAVVAGVPQLVYENPLTFEQAGEMAR